VVRPLEEEARGRAPDPPPRASPLGLVLELRSDFGFERLIEVEFTNDRRIRMNMNDGLAIGAGLTFLPLAGGHLATRITLGVKLDRILAANGSALFIAFPVDLMEAAHVGMFRLGAGVSVLLAPQISGKGMLEGERVAFDPAPGAVLDAEWIVAPRARTGVGVRASWHRFIADGVVRGAPSVGLVIRADLDLVGRPPD
jgi:hypothetical protein